MKFKDLRTGLTLETNNKFVIEQYKKYSDKYKSIEDIELEPKSKKK